jgi:hypothetical protein
MQLFFSPDISLLVSVPDHGQIRQNIHTLLGYLGSEWSGACQYVSRRVWIISGESFSPFFFSITW